MPKNSDADVEFYFSSTLKNQQRQLQRERKRGYKLPSKIKFVDASGLKQNKITNYFQYKK